MINTNSWGINWDIRKVNSATKYPSIPTYHVLGDRGILTEERSCEFEGGVYLTEKIDGTNSRLIITNEYDYLVGSREELLYASGDLLWNPAQHIAEPMIELAKALCGRYLPAPMMVFYFECYGGSNNGKIYGAKPGFRLFDMWATNPTEFQELHDGNSIEQISSWRQNGGQPFEPVVCIEKVDTWYGLQPVPYLAMMDASDLPETVEDTYDFLRGHISITHCATDDSRQGRAEGLVIRDKTRNTIAKIRFEDYERTLKKRGVIK